ncbi:MAG: MarR family transcriptional regulator [Candidatus Omnitrophica bacterium]|nr:MarR family transcriptional regulator [Candidatus Omnitrophota bacterium]
MKDAMMDNHMKARSPNQHDFQVLEENLTFFMRDLLGHGLRILASHKINLAQYFILFQLNHGSALPMSSFAKHYPLSKPSFTNNIDRLISRKLVTRMRGTEDRRTILVSITTHGKKLMGSLQRTRLKFLQSYFNRLPSAKRHALAEILTALRPVHEESCVGEGIKNILKK